VSPASSPFFLSRILVALDASPHSLAALEAAAALAAMMDAELSGLFVEDIALLRLAESPIAREVLYFSPKDTPLTPASMETKLRAQSEQARRALQAVAERARVRWTFRSVRGDVTSAVLAAAAEADLLALGTRGWSVSHQVRTGSTALRAARSTLPVLLLAEHGVPANGSLVVYYDGSPGAKRGLLAAARLSQAGMDGIVVFVSTRNVKPAAELQEEASHLLKQADVMARYRLTDLKDEIGLLCALKEEHAGTVILGGRDAIEKFQRLEQSLRNAKVAFLLVDGSELDSE
jgi:nucleotide-binding universal stress UspA family protein